MPDTKHIGPASEGSDANEFHLHTIKVQIFQSIMVTLQVKCLALSTDLSTRAAYSVISKMMYH